MTEFWIFCALLLAVALGFVVWPLWRGAARNNDVVRDAANLEIFRDQIAEMDADLANGLLTPELYEQGKRELQARLLDEVKSPAGKGEAEPRNPLKILAVVLTVLLPLASVGMYWKLGNQNVFLPQDPHANAEGFGAVLSEAGIKALEEKLASNPNMPEDWLLLARSYAQLERWTDSVKAYEKLTGLVPNEAQLWAEYADVLGMVHGQSLVGPPTTLLDKALALDPANPKALALSGAAAMERGDYPAAVRHWENLMKQLPPGSSDAQMIAGALEQARNFLAQTKGGKMRGQAPAAAQNQPAAPGKERISGTVTLGDAIKAKAAPDDTVFILARAAEGPPMPLAVIRKRVKDLPLQFTLDDSMAMAPQMKLSGFERVVVIARISKSGDAKGQPGDLQGMSAVLKPGTSGLKISIDSVLK
ncbi:MAG TPA: c-type cytochrome biogenesis protein CcmI [Gallionellaceae bacterium]